VLSDRVCTVLCILLSEGVLLPRQLLCETMKHPFLEKKLDIDVFFEICYLIIVTN